MNQDLLFRKYYMPKSLISEKKKNFEKINILSPIFSTYPELIIGVLFFDYPLYE